jgi:hypothetical protein
MTNLPDHLHGHATIAEAGACEVCRPQTIASVRELYGDPEMADYFNHYLLGFVDDGAPLGIAIVPAPDFDTAVENAWACGCNPGGIVGGGVVSRELVERAAVPTCVLLTGPAATAAKDALAAAHKEGDVR